MPTNPRNPDCRNCNGTGAFRYTSCGCFEWCSECQRDNYEAQPTNSCWVRQGSSVTHGWNVEVLGMPPEEFSGEICSFESSFDPSSAGFDARITLPIQERTGKVCTHCYGSLLLYLSCGCEVECHYCWPNHRQLDKREK